MALKTAMNWCSQRQYYDLSLEALEALEAEIFVGRIHLLERTEIRLNSSSKTINVVRYCANSMVHTALKNK
jgi:hypothetical protein